MPRKMPPRTEEHRAALKARALEQHARKREQAELALTSVLPPSATPEPLAEPDPARKYWNEIIQLGRSMSKRDIRGKRPVRKSGTLTQQGAR